MAPQGIGMRKVRASQGGITDNIRRGRPPGKCNRNRLPTQRTTVPRTVQMERRGKSSPARQATVCKCKPYPMQRLHAGIRRNAGHAGPAEPRRRLRGGWRQPSQIDGSRGVRSAQNPAYRPAGRFRTDWFHGAIRGSGGRDFSLLRGPFFGGFPLTKREASIYNRGGEEGRGRRSLRGSLSRLN